MKRWKRMGPDQSDQECGFAIIFSSFMIGFLFWKWGVLWERVEKGGE